MTSFHSRLIITAHMWYTTYTCMYITTTNNQIIKKNYVFKQPIPGTYMFLKASQTCVQDHMHNVCVQYIQFYMYMYYTCYMYQKYNKKSFYLLCTVYCTVEINNGTCTTYIYICCTHVHQEYMTTCKKNTKDTKNKNWCHLHTAYNIYVATHTYICMYVCMYIHVHTYIHTYMYVY